jgi:hypothetical protein
MLLTLRKVPHIQLTLDVRQVLSFKSQQLNHFNAVPASNKRVSINIVVINQLPFDMFWNSPYILYINVFVRAVDSDINRIVPHYYVNDKYLAGT